MKPFFIRLVIGLALTLAGTSVMADGTVEDGFKAYQAEDYDTAYKTLLPHASTYATPGFIEAQWLIGNLYLGGNSVDKSVPKAWVWHQKAIQNAYDIKNYALIQKILKPYLENNLIEGKIEYAKLLRRVGNAEQIKEARAFIEQAATSGNAMAQYEMRNLGSGFVDKFERFRYQIKWLKLSADQGYAPAQIAYGIMFRHGGPAVTQKIFSDEVLKNWPDDDQARRQWKKGQHIKWALKAADRGDMDGEFAAAVAYSNNSAHTQAAVYYSRAMTLGHFKAELKLAKAYDVGLGVAQDRQRAANLYQDIMNRVGDDAILIDNNWKYVRSDALGKLNTLKNEADITPQALKSPQKPNWIVGKWGAVEENGKGGYRETTGLLANACSDHDGRGYATFSFKNNELIADIIGNTAATIMFDAFEEKPAPYTALDDTHVAVYPAQWGEGWLMLEQVRPEVLKVIVQNGDSSDRNFFLKLCRK
jgi:TPR repeat protein